MKMSCAKARKNISFDSFWVIYERLLQGEIQ